MSSVQTIEHLSGAFRCAEQQAIDLRKEALDDNSYGASFDSRIFSLAQAVSSAAAIPILIISALFISLWKIRHWDPHGILLTTGAALAQSADHFRIIFQSLIYAVAPISLSNYEQEISGNLIVDKLS